HAPVQHHRAADNPDGAFLRMTTTDEIEKLLHDYREWLKEKTTLREVNNAWVEITTPYLDRHNDMLQIYARAEDGGYVLTDVSYTPRVKFTGISDYDHLFDFVIPKSRKQPERILQAINRPTRETAEAFIYKWTDTREVRPVDSKAYAILNDTEQPVSGGVLDA